MHNTFCTDLPSSVHQHDRYTLSCVITSEPCYLAQYDAIYMYLHLHVTFIYAIVLPVYILYRIKSYPAARWIASDTQSSSIEVSVHLFSKLILIPSIIYETPKNGI